MEYTKKQEKENYGLMGPNWKERLRQHNEASIYLSMGDGFTGRTYSLILNRSSITLLHSLGSNEDEEKSRQKAIAILKILEIDMDFDKLQFIHDGTL